MRRVTWAARTRILPAAAILAVASAVPGVEAVAGIRPDRAGDRSEGGRGRGLSEQVLADASDAVLDALRELEEDGSGAAVGDPYTIDEGMASGRGGNDGTGDIEPEPDDIPDVAFGAYGRAERAVGVSDPECGLSWSLLAAIGRVESDHGRFGGATLDDDGNTSRPIRGVPLDGRPGVATIPDTDDGELDGDDRYDRAVGPMQFIPTTWERVAVDANADGERDPDNIYDAALAAAVYLCAGDTDLTSDEGMATAIRRYNRSSSYVETVMDLAEAYERGGRVPLPDDDEDLPDDVPTVDDPGLPPANPGDPPRWGPPDRDRPTPRPSPGEGDERDPTPDPAPAPSPGRPHPTQPPTTPPASLSPGPRPTTPPPPPRPGATTPPPTDTPPTTPSPTVPPPAGPPPTTGPPPTDPPTTPPTTDPPTTDPPTTPPTTDPPTTDPPTTPPTTDPPPTDPPTTDPPTTPPTTDPPTTDPPTTDPPTTPPTTEPPTTTDPCDGPPGDPDDGGAATPVTGDLPSGPFSLTVAGTDGSACVRLTLPTGVAPAIENSAAALAQEWRVNSADGRHVVWGLVPSDVATVLVTVEVPDGDDAGAEPDRVGIPVSTAAGGVEGVTHRAFAAALPEGGHIVAMTGWQADGTASLEAVDVEASLAPIADFDPATGAYVPVVPAA